MDASTNGFEDDCDYINDPSFINGTRYEKSTNHVEINDDTRAALTCTNTSTRVLPGVGDILHEVKNLKQQLASVKEERDEFKEEVTFLKYQLAYRAQVQNLQKEMSGKTEPKQPGAKKPKSVRFSANIAVNHLGHSEGEDETDNSFEESKDDISDSSFDIEEFSRLRTETEELQDVLYDFYHDSKMAGKNENILVGDIESHPSESISSLVCRVLVNYDKLCEEHRILEEEKSKLDEDKIQLCNSMAKLREQFHDAVDSNIEEIEDLNRENEDLRAQVKTFGGKNSEVVSALIQAREQYVSRLKAITDLAKGSTSDKLLQLLKKDALLAESELKEAKQLVPKGEEDKSNKLKRVQSLPSTLRQDSAENTERGGLLRELKTCKNLQESQRKQIQKILDEKLALETQVAELKRHVVLLKAERRVNVKTKSKLVQTERETQREFISNEDKNSAPSSAEVESLSRRCKDLENKLEQAKRERLVVEREKTSLLLSLDANIEKKDALEEQLAALQEKLSESGQKETRKSETKAVCTQTDGTAVEQADKSLSETDGGFKASYKGISEAKVELEKIRVQEQDKQIAMLKRENEAVKEKLKKAEEMSQTLQNCLKELTDEKHELLDSVEELNEEKVELEEARSKLEKELGGTRREKFVVDEVSDIRNKERKVGDSLEASKAKLAQLDLKVVEVLTLIGNEETGTKEKKSDPDQGDQGVEDMIGSLLSSVENLKLIVIAFKTTYDNTKGDSLRTKNELHALNREKTEIQAFVEKLTKQNGEMAESLENNKKSQTSNESYLERLKSNNARLERELGQVHGSKTGYEKSLTESRRREEDLRRQLKNISTKRDDLQKTFDQVAKKSTETSSLLAAATKEVEAVRSMNETLTTELEHLRDDLEGTVEDRDELLELLDRIVCENGTGEQKQGLGLKVERIRERSKSEETLTGIGLNDSGRTKPVGEKLVVFREMNMDYAAAGENELFEEKEKIEKNGKGVEALEEENQRLKEMVEKMLNDQKKMEVVLNSLSEANAEIQQGLEESLEHTEQIRLQGSENGGGEDAVDFAPDYQATTSDENAELRRLHEAMVGTNEALSTNLRRLHDEKTRSEQLKTSFHDVTRKNTALEKNVESLGKNVESLTKDKERTEKEILDLKKKQKNFERETQRSKNEKLDLESLLEENNSRVKDLKFQIDSLTEINQDLRETNEKLSGSSKEMEKKWIKVNDKFDELECQNEDLKKAKKRLEKELAEQGKLRAGLELELERTEATIASLESEISSYTKKGRELEKSLETSERELAILRETAGKVTKLEQDAQNASTLKSEMEDRVTKLQQDAQDADTLRTEMEEIKRRLSEREQRVAELETDVTRLKKEIQNSQRFVKAVSQENDTLRDSLSEWEQEASKLRRHVHQLSQEAESRNQNGEEKKDSKSTELDKVRSVKAFEAMQVEMDAVNKHLKSLIAENQEFATNIDSLTEENAEMNDRNIQLLTRYDMVSKDLEKKTAEIAKLNKDAKNSDSRSKKNNELREKHVKETTSLQTKIDKLDLENTLLKNSLANTLNEEKRLAESMEHLIHSQKGKKIQNGGKSINRDRSKRPKDIVNEECWEIRTDISELSTTKPDLIRDSTEVKDEFMIERKYRSADVIEGSGTGTDTQELLSDLLKGQMNLKSYCHEISQVVKDKRKDHGSEAKHRIESSLDTAKAGLEKAEQLNKDLESNLAKKEEELTKITEEKTKIESEAATIKEKCDKLQAVFRALVVMMKDKKGGDKKDGEEAEGPTRIIDYIKGIKTKYTTLVAEKENLETKVGELQKEIDEHKARAKQDEKRLADGVKKKRTASEDKNVSEDKERILNELLLSSARDKRRLLEKLQEIFDEFSKVKSRLDEELDSSPSSNFEKISQEFAESIGHTERFIQSVAHDRPVTVVADSAAEKDPNLELAKENEELIGRISAIQTSRRREAKSFKDELTRTEKNKKEAVKEEETKWKEEMDKAQVENEKNMKEKEQAAAEVRNSLKQEVSQLKLDMRRVSDEHEVAQRTARNEARLASEKLEAEMKRLKADMERKVAENDSKMAEVKRKAEADVKESARMAQVEISQVRANWADAERKVRAASEEKLDAVRELERVKGERGDEAARSTRELQKLKVALDSAQKQASEREDVFKRERDRMQRSISNLEASVRNSEASGVERTQKRISEFQWSLDELSKQNQQLETARRNLEQTLGAEIEKLRYDNSKLQSLLREQSQQRRIIGGNEQQRRPAPNVHSGERVKVMGTVRQPPVEKPRLMTSLESAPGPMPVRQPPVEKPRLMTSVESAPGPMPVRQLPVEKPRLVTPVESAPGPIPGDPHRRVKVREGQATSVHVSRPQDQGMRRSSDPRDTVSDELGAMFRQLDNASEWMEESRKQSSVIHARPVQARMQVTSRDVQSQKLQPEWEARQDRTWPKQKDTHRYPPNNTRPPASHTRPQPSSQRPGYYNEDSRHKPTYPNSKPITRQVQGSLEGANMTSSVDPRRAVEVKRLPVKEKPHSTKSRRPRRPSVGSDDVFVKTSPDATPTLASHGSKTSDFWRSRSLDDLTDTSEDRAMKHSGHDGSRGRHEKLPKNYSGPRRGEPYQGGGAQIRGTGQKSGSKKVTPLKGMEHVLFQSQI